jgi:hypothetical protein
MGLCSRRGFGHFWRYYCWSLGEKYFQSYQAEKKLESLFQRLEFQTPELERQSLELCYHVVNPRKRIKWFFELTEVARDPNVGNQTAEYILTHFECIKNRQEALKYVLAATINTTDPTLNNFGCTYILNHLDELNWGTRMFYCALITANAKDINIRNQAALYVVDHLSKAPKQEFDSQKKFLDSCNYIALVDFKYGDIEFNLRNSAAQYLLDHFADYKYRDDALKVAFQLVERKILDPKIKDAAAQYTLDHLQDAKDAIEGYDLAKDIVEDTKNPEIKKIAEAKAKDLRDQAFPQSKKKSPQNKEQSMNFPSPSGFLNGTDLDKIIQAQNVKIA